VYFILLLAVLVTICLSAFNKFGLVWFGLVFHKTKTKGLFLEIFSETVPTFTF